MREEEAFCHVVLRPVSVDLGAGTTARVLAKQLGSLCPHLLSEACDLFQEYLFLSVNGK